jgi:membrane protein implicated in regulation of membrane protease activity
METFFLVCAGLGGTLVLLQFLAGVFGIGGDHGDAGHHDFASDHDHEAHHGEGNWFLGLLTLRAICAAVLFFGLGGLVAGYYDLGLPAQLGSAFLAGFAALYVVATLMKSLYRLRADGTVRIQRAVGHTGTVYLRVPGNRAGAGKVTLNLQNRTVELEAFTAADELPTGTPIRVVAVLGPNTVEVAHVHAPSEA